MQRAQLNRGQLPRKSTESVLAQRTGQLRCRNCGKTLRCPKCGGVLERRDG